MYMLIFRSSVIFLISFGGGGGVIKLINTVGVEITHFLNAGMEDL